VEYPSTQPTSEHAHDKLLLFLEGQTRVLEMIAEAVPLERILDELMRVLEQQGDGMLCSVLLLSDDGKHLRHGGAPSLPKSYTRAIDGSAIGPRVGSCGTAAFLKRQVIVSDIARDPLWADYKQLALSAGLQACWSTPILSKRGEVLGTFAMYYRQPVSPSSRHLQLIAAATHLASIAIERDRLHAQLALERQRLASVVDQLPAGVVVSDAAGRLVMGNRQMEIIFRQPFVPSANLDDYRKWGLCHLDGTPYRRDELPLARSLKHGEEVAGTDMLIHRADGSTACISVFSAPIRDRQGRIVGGVLAFWDISERRRAEEERERLIEQLRSSIHARDDSLSVLAVAAHEVKSPLTALQLQADSIVRQLRKEPVSLPTVEQRASSSVKQLGRLAHLVGELLDVARLTAGKLPVEREDLDMVEVVREVTERFRDQFDQRACALTLRAPDAVWGRWDRMRVDQVVTNLLSNALKYGRDQPVVVTVAADAERARIEVQDSGIGIAPDQQALIFERFGRGVSEHREGLGLGLWITRHIVEALGGTISVRSQLGSGSTFLGELPREGG